MISLPLKWKKSGSYSLYLSFFPVICSRCLACCYFSRNYQYCPFYYLKRISLTHVICFIFAAMRFVKVNVFLVVLFLFFLATGSLMGQEDSTYQKKSFFQRMDSIKNWKLEKGKYTLTPFIAPSYSPEMQLTLTAGGLWTFKMKPDNPVLSRSSVPFSIGYSTNGSLQVSIKANLYAKGDRLRISGEYWLKDMPDNYWGAGYLNGRYVEKGDSTTKYHRDWQQFKFKVVYEVVTNFFVGLNYDRNRTKATDINPLMEEDPDFQRHGDNVQNSGFGLVLRYDSRDFPENAYKGFLLELAGTGYGKHTSSNNIFQAYELDYRQYQKIVREGSTLAWQIKTRNTHEDVPWTEMSMVGTPFDLRGYTWGHYRDRTMLFALAEYRYMLPRKNPTTTGKMYGPFGFVAWAGAGSIAENFEDIKYWLPNAGIGLRFELQERMNVRIDYGFGINSSAFYISFNEAF